MKTEQEVQERLQILLQFKKDKQAELAAIPKPTSQDRNFFDRKFRLIDAEIHILRWVLA